MRTKFKKLASSMPWWIVVPILSVVILLAYDASVRSDLREAEADSGIGPRQKWRIMEVGPDGVYGRIDNVRPAGRAMSVRAEPTDSPRRARSEILRLFQETSPDTSTWLSDLPSSTQDAWWHLYDQIEAREGDVIFRKKDLSENDREYELLDKSRRILGRVVLERRGGHWEPIEANADSNE